MSASKVLHVNDINFQQEVLQSDKPVLLDFSAAWCGPCKALTPVVESVAAKHEGSLKVAKLDIDESPGVATQFGVRSVPTLILFKGGKEVDRKVGLVPEAQLVAFFQPHVS